MDGGVSPIFRKLIQTYTSNLDFEFVEATVVHGHSDREDIRSLIDDKTAAITA